MQLSLITTRIGDVAAAPVTVHVTDPPAQGDASVLNYWVIPDFRPSDETMINSWCRKTAAVRDLVIIGQAGAVPEPVSGRTRTGPMARDRCPGWNRGSARGRRDDLPPPRQSCGRWPSRASP